jgi:hypothetical protein
MVYSTVNDSATRTPDTSVPGVVLAVSPNNRTVLINDQVRKVFYLSPAAGGTAQTFPGVGNVASWTPDSKTLYVSDSASLGPNHSDTLYVYNVNTGWTTYDLSSSGGATSLALTIPSVGAYLSGQTTVAHTWCPAGNAAQYANLVFYPQGDSVAARTDALAATTNGKHVLGAGMVGGGVQLSDIGVTIPSGSCPAAIGNQLQPLTLAHNLNQLAVNGINATAVNQVVASPASNLAFITYDGSTPGAKLPYYLPVSGGSAGTLGYLTFAGGSSITAPVAGTFSPDDKLFFVSTAGDNKVHFIDTQKLLSDPSNADTQQISPNLPACAPGSDPDCTITSPTSNSVPATKIAVKPRTTT